MWLNRIPAASLLAIVLVAAPHDASAQEAAAPAERPAPTVDVSRLPISLARIHRELQQATFREQLEGLNLRVTVDVIAPAPPLSVTIFTREDNLLTGPVPFGAPTHREMIDHVTPQEFRSPAADFGALFRWLAEKAK